MINFKSQLSDITRISDVTNMDVLRMHKRERDYPLTLPLESITKADNLNISRYPDLDPVYKTLSSHFSLDVASVLVTAGCDIALRTFYESLANTPLFLVPATCYAMNYLYISIYHPNAEVQAYNILNGNIDMINVIDMLAGLPPNAVILLENPSGQSGKSIDRVLFPELLDKARKMGVTIVVDETYLETRSANCSVIPYISNLNLVIVTSFSKAYGLAGLRAGAIMSHPKNMSILRALKPMHEITGATASVLSYAISDKPSLEAYRNQILLDEQTWISMCLHYEDLIVEPTDSNFIRFRSSSYSATEITSYLESRKIRVKIHPPDEFHQEWLSASLGNDNNTKLLLCELKSFLYSQYL